MTFDEFKVDLLAFLEKSTVNLGRKTAKTRQAFLNEVIAKFDALEADAEQVIDMVEKQSEALSPMGNSVIRIKPTNKKNALDVGKGVHAMTSGESGRADEQLNRSPFTNRTRKEVN